MPIFLFCFVRGSDMLLPDYLKKSGLKFFEEQSIIFAYVNFRIVAGERKYK